MKNVHQIRAVSRELFLRVLIGLLITAGTALRTQAANRVVAWGDINYDTSVASEQQSGRKPAVVQIAAGDFQR